MNTLTAAVERAFNRIVRRRGDYLTCFGSPEGKRVLSDILRLGGVSADLNTGDSFTTGVNVGAHRLAVAVGSMLHMSDEEMIQAAQETTNDG